MQLIMQSYYTSLRLFYTKEIVGLKKRGITYHRYTRILLRRDRILLQAGRVSLRWTSLGLLADQV